MSPILGLLNEIRRRRYVAMFVGKSSLTKLADYLRGYEHAVSDYAPEIKDHFLADFRDWIEVRLQDRVHGWENAILLKSKDEADAVDHFWKLLDEFVATHPVLGDQPKSPAGLVPSANGLAESVSS